MASSNMALLIPHSYNLRSRNKQPSEKDDRRCSPYRFRHRTGVPNKEAERLQRIVRAPAAQARPKKGKHVKKPDNRQESGDTTTQQDAAKIKEILRDLKSELECPICRKPVRNPHL
ncbi:hypothetical protein PC9H_008675 [Pleurotus ostreatus]|uniref:Uncharacterized protein n=1 Tax=Pleurotus ostreatus TaxID=5322 RepID=A0A8H7DSU1_PLEOS|nr:uncharacterized protein PC9H_010212 [Pleurotus ostreatus]XP_036629611.1 uncharacterized protein PC9H_008675 [Pleurotus ostreatus]KAF7424901.1 hypothetical protein PC9H_010212 [Pleurotus ostreatus]KAF7426307.1 hypothetical protein PC9H_008675 [Pleurotus ostreatus]